ncbi:MAG TPA: efflux RND transporter periplasmic adaptor subunit [Steroidobacteraceae bacterium]|nr:efflux RND transporter periplasmic adaptor subunit [Steroidobacteraceae bacterium]
MSTYEHLPTARGTAFLWGGALLGIVLLAALITHGFGVLAPRTAAPEIPALVHRGGEIVVPEGSPLRTRLTVEPAPSELASPRLTLPAIVESDPARTAAVLTPLAGRIRELRVALGERVARGQVLAVIDSPDLAQAYDDYDKAADALALATRNLARARGQVQIGAASERDADQAMSDRAQALAEFTRAQERLLAIGVPLSARPRERRLLLRAPMSGSITSLAVSAGNMINDATQPLMTIADLSTVWVTALVAEKDLAAVARGESAEVALSAYPERRLRGTVAFVSDVLEPDSRRDKVRIAFANPGHLLKPNMFATVTLLEPRRTRVVLPATALLMENDRTSVFVATAPWTFERRAVDARLEDGSTVAISSGVRPGEQVVVRGAILLND